MTDRRRGRRGRVALLSVALLSAGAVAAACGADTSPATDPEALTQLDEPTPPTASGVPEDGSEVAPARASSPGAAPAAAAVQQLDQPAVWPAADVVFATPEEAAADFVSSVLIEGEPTLGEFQQGDARSGEIEVLFAGETGDLDPPQTKGTLILRQLGPSDGWFVLAATSPGATIGIPAAGATVAAGPLTVAGEGRGFESTLAVTAFSPGVFESPIDTQIGAGGAFEELEPYSVELDLSTAQPGDVVAIVVRGDSGLGNDPSTFAAVPIVIAADGDDDGDGDGNTTATTIPATE